MYERCARNTKRGFLQPAETSDVEKENEMAGGGGAEEVKEKSKESTTVIRSVTDCGLCV